MHNQQEEILVSLYKTITNEEDRQFIIDVTQRISARQKIPPNKPKLHLVVGGSIPLGGRKFGSSVR